MSLNPTYSLPKRKRSQPPASALKVSPMQLNTTPQDVVVPEEDSAAESPRMKVACRFEDLRIATAGFSKYDFHQLEGEIGYDEVARKRIRKLDDADIEIPETPQRTTVKLDAHLHSPPLETELDPVIFKGIKGQTNRFTSGLVRSYPSINRLADSKSRSRKRSSTPPSAVVADSILVDDMIVDPDRAALTWHDDEITGHDPDDPDDDGEGINGIGFKPTPAMARARADRRKQQLAEYKSREAREARAKRSEKRRGSPSLTMAPRDSETARRVRFMEENIDVQSSLLA